MAGIALLGAGIFPTEALRRINANLKAIYSRSKKSAASLLAAAEKLGFPASEIKLYSDDSEGHELNALLANADIGAVVIALPIPVQPTVIRRALAAGKHVLAEKPIAKDVASARELIADYQKQFEPKGLVLSIAEQFRYMEAHDVARKWVVDDKAVGTLTQVHARIWRNIKAGGKYIETPWRKVPEYQGGFILDGGVHHIALLRYVSGLEVVETRGFARQTQPHLPPVDTANSAILLSNGATGTLSISFAAGCSATQLDFLGSTGTLACTADASGTTLTLKALDGTVTKQETIESHGIDNELKAFLDAVKTGHAEGKAGVYEALNDVAIVESICSEAGGKVANWEQ
ncbi:NAD(P)-binding domain protein [Niveomyces insectorum RCEF 264]|uniref:NAD(P)-binding domain protein n=1 Tax=Niveomyces insectorum RCEF 264 TaxID=1081102 RepID=A0A167NF94_9HYPO|nr:NAD(P)-binding domain protein [Niveomyces insectorum RCEF 264]